MSAVRQTKYPLGIATPPWVRTFFRGRSCSGGSRVDECLHTHIMLSLRIIPIVNLNARFVILGALFVILIPFRVQVGSEGSFFLPPGRQSTLWVSPRPLVPGHVFVDVPAAGARAMTNIACLRWDLMIRRSGVFSHPDLKSGQVVWTAAGSLPASSVSTLQVRCPCASSKSAYNMRICSYKHITGATRHGSKRNSPPI